MTENVLKINNYALKPMSKLDRHKRKTTTSSWLATRRNNKKGNNLNQKNFSKIFFLLQLDNIETTTISTNNNTKLIDNFHFKFNNNNNKDVNINL